VSNSSYRSKMQGGKTYTQRVVAQPTVQSSVKVKMDPKSPTGISEDKRK
jgi:hypothetical protein